MSRVQTSANFYSDVKALIARVDRLERVTAETVLKDVNTTSLSSAQIDAAIFGASAGAQPTDGLIIRDTTNSLLLVRQGGHWHKVTLTNIP